MKKVLTATALAISCLFISNSARAQIWAYPPNAPSYAMHDLRPQCFGPGHVIWPERRGEVFGPWREDLYVDAPIDGGDFPRPVPCTHRPLRTESGAW